SHNVKGAGSSNFQPQILISCSGTGENEEFIDIAAPEAGGGLPQQGNGSAVRGSGGRREVGTERAAAVSGCTRPSAKGGVEISKETKWVMAVCVRALGVRRGRKINTSRFERCWKLYLKAAKREA